MIEELRFLRTHPQCRNFTESRCQTPDTSSRKSGICYLTFKGLPPLLDSRYIRSVLWLGRPPYLRWFAAASVVVAAFTWDASQRATAPFPFAAVDLARGQPITMEDIEWRQIPAGTLVMPLLDGTSAATAILAGDPLVVSLISTSPPLPDDTWAVPVVLPLGAGIGMTVRLVFIDGTATPGVIIQPATEDSLGLVTHGLVAVPESVADSVALASANGDLVVLLEP